MEHKAAADVASPPAQQSLRAGSSGEELFQCASHQLPLLEGNLADTFNGAAAYRTSLSPAVSAGCRRSSLIGAPQQVVEAAEVALRVSLAGGLAEADPVPAPGGEQVRSSAEAVLPEAELFQGKQSTQHEVQRQDWLLPEVCDEAAADAPSASDVLTECPLAPTAEVSGASSSSAGASQAPALHPEASRLSMASMASSAAAPSLHIEYSEASLRYSGGRAITGVSARTHHTLMRIRIQDQGGTYEVRLPCIVA